MLTTSNHPQANGLSERLNATLTGKLRLLHLQHPRASWTMLQSKVVKAYNDTPHSVTGFPPSYLMDGSLPKELSQHLDPYPSVTESRRLALQRTKERHKLDKIRFDKNHRSPDFEVGDLVLTKIYQHPNTGKLVPYFSGPYEIIEVISPYTVRINRHNQAQNLETEIIHVNKLKHYSEDTKYIFTPHSTNNNSKPKSYFIYNHFPPEIFHDDYKNYASTLSNPFNHMNPDIFLDNVEPTLTARYISTPDTIPKIAIRLEPSPTTKIMLPSSPTLNHTPQISPQFSAPLINCDNTKLENRSVIIKSSTSSSFTPPSKSSTSPTFTSSISSSFTPPSESIVTPYKQVNHRPHQHSQNQSNFDKYHIRTIITNKLYASGHSNPSHNSSKNEVKALKSLRDQKDIVVTRSDKGSQVVILKMEAYKSKMQDILGDLDTFEGTSPAQVSNIQKAYKSSLSRLKRTNQITSAQFQNYTSKPSNTPYIYGLPKVHKPDIPLRPIVAYHLSPAAHLARYLSDVLKPLIKTYNSHSIQDSSDFIHKLKEIDNSENYSICTYDVKSLFLCLPHDLIIKELRKLLASSDLPHTQSCTITDLFQICLNMNTLEFDGHYYLQKRGSPMGSPLSNIAAGLVMSGLDSWIMNRDDLGIKLWIRYVDDIFCMYPKANNSLITDALNAYQECLKFTQNQDKNGVIPFLDVLVINTDSNIETTVYYKPEFNPTYIHYGSHAPASHKITTIKTLTKRIFTH
ncbi:hypothetical protein LAZ67_9000201 [Cordylochernes scorpioides]|uniref:Integrase catalytic domain-containing protein n=1 Tax=Cordylochernes scorpioides TaxID=51811 RepID=A0ABY6KSB0_9ARAC|nr:hypothetical protein LAZ67_9000201 [Cordylochernes scorpioides]